MLLQIAERFRDALVPFLVIGTIALVTLLSILVVQRLVRAAVESRRDALRDRYRPIINEAVASGAAQAIDAASHIPKRHSPIAAEIVLGILRLVKGLPNDRARIIAEQLGLNRQWREQLQSRVWWRRSEAALALGLTRDLPSVALLTPLLDDEHEQVRAAAIDALGQIGDRDAIPALLARLGDPTRHERTRLVQALRAFGEDATRALVTHGESHAADRAVVATVLSFIGGSAAADALLQWSASDDAEVRAAVWSALGTIGLDDRTFYHALKALNADEAAVRAAAARALARSGRPDAAAHLAGRLDDDWEVAAHAARALARLGADGHAALQLRSDAGAGLGRDLARQVLWESGHR